MEHSQALDRSLPVIDIHPLIAGTAARDWVAAQIGQACREYGFFYIVGHGVDEELQQRLERLSRQFFAQAIEKKSRSVTFVCNLGDNSFHDQVLFVKHNNGTDLIFRLALWREAQHDVEARGELADA